MEGAGRLARGAFGLASLTLGRGSLDGALTLAGRAGDLVYFGDRRARRAAMDRIAAFFGPSMPTPARQRVVRAAFRNSARCLAEFARAETLVARLNDYVDVDGWEHVERCRAAGGTIVATGLTGNWELPAACLARSGAPVALVGRRPPATRAAATAASFRLACGIETVRPENPTCAHVLQNIAAASGFVVVVVDPAGRAATTGIPGLGRPCRPPEAAAALAFRHQWPVLPVFAQRRPAGGHRVTVFPPVRLTTGSDRRQAAREISRHLSTLLVERVRRNPAEWMWWERAPCRFPGAVEAYVR